MKWRGQRRRASAPRPNAACRPSAVGGGTDLLEAAPARLAYKGTRSSTPGVRRPSLTRPRPSSPRPAQRGEGQGEGSRHCPGAPPSRRSLHPVDAENYSLCVTVDTALKKDLDELRALLSQKLPRGDLTAVLREAVQCALEKHRKRRGADEPARKRKSPAAAKAAKKTGSESASPSPQRCGARCGNGTRVAAPGGARTANRCGSTWKVELDHVRPAALGGPSTVENQVHPPPPSASTAPTPPRPSTAAPGWPRRQRTAPRRGARPRPEPVGDLVDPDPQGGRLRHRRACPLDVRLERRPHATMIAEGLEGRRGMVSTVCGPTSSSTYLTSR